MRTWPALYGFTGHWGAQSTGVAPSVEDAGEESGQTKRKEDTSPVCAVILILRSMFIHNEF